MKPLCLLVGVVLLGGCQVLDDYNRTYFAEGDLTSRSGRIGGRISHADKPGTGKPSLEWGLSGSTGKAIVPARR